MSGNPLDLSGYPDLLTPAEVGAILRVDPKSVTRYAKRGDLISIRGIGGHRRYLRDQIQAILLHGVEGVPAELKARLDAYADQLTSVHEPLAITNGGAK